MDEIIRQLHSAIVMAEELDYMDAVRLYTRILCRYCRIGNFNTITNVRGE